MQAKNRILFIFTISLILTSLFPMPIAAQGKIRSVQPAGRSSSITAAVTEPQKNSDPEWNEGQGNQGQYIVILQTSVKVSQKQEAIQKAVAASGGRVKAFYRAAINGYSAELPPAALEHLREDPDVAMIEPDAVVSINDGWLEPFSGYTASSQSNPVWGLDRIDQRDLPLDNNYSYGNSAPDVHVYVVDTGLRATHQEFTGRVGNGFSVFADGTSDCHGHGTHVAGTIGGSTYGVAKSLTIHPVRVMNCEGNGYTSDIIKGLEWIIDHGTSPGVVNMSLGGEANYILDLAVNSVLEAGFSVVAAAGNVGGDACDVSPARVPDVITVGATDLSDVRASFSNFGNCLDLFAPGVSITSAFNTSDSAIRTINGTSMAAPHVAGAVALYLEINPTASPQMVAGFIVDTSTSGRVTNTGGGSPNRLLFVSGEPILLDPIGIVLTHSRTFTWARSAGATQYELELFEGSATEPLETREYKDDICAEVWCSADPGFELDVSVGDYQWRVRAYVNGEWGVWTDRVEFKIVEIRNIFIPLITAD